MTHTIWANIPNHNGYRVSIDGIVQSFRNKGGDILDEVVTILKPSVEKGYHRVRLSNGNGTFKAMSIHRLVGICFIPNLLNKRDINHIDGNTIGNNIENLEWSTQQENESHSWDILGKSHLPTDCKRRSNALKKGRWEDEVVIVIDSRDMVDLAISMKYTHTYTDIVATTGINKNKVPELLNAKVIHLKHHSKNRSPYETISTSN